MKKVLILLVLCSIFFSCKEESTIIIDHNPFTDLMVVNFEKENFADPMLEENQDRISENIWITRGDEEGLFNAAKESVVESNVSPVGTLWAFGTLDDIPKLNFVPFRLLKKYTASAHTMRRVILHLVEENEYIELVFTSWTSGNQTTINPETGEVTSGGGGFSYVRSLPVKIN